MVYLIEMVRAWEGSDDRQGGFRMFMQQDWLMRQIEMMTAAIARLLLGKELDESGMGAAFGQERSDELDRKLIALLRDGRLGEAEDLLFFQLDEVGADRGILAAAIDFYQRANELTDDELEARGFSRSELWEGLGEVVERCGLSIPGFWDER